MQIVDRKDKLPGARIRTVEVLLCAAFVALAFGLWNLQVLQAGKYARMAQHNRIRTEPIPAPRGRIFDRRGRLLVDNYPSFTAYLQRDSARAWRADLPAIAHGLSVPLADLQAVTLRFRSAPVYRPIPIKQDITVADEAFIASHRDQFPELMTVMASRRLYPKNGYAANLIGYVGEPTEAQLASGAMDPGEMVGKSGVEQVYNAQLMGQDGHRRVMVDSRGRVVGTLSDQPPVAGKDLHLTLDEDVQLAAELAMGDRPGAVVALDPRTGAVLAMVSRPTFDPNVFVQGLSPEQWKLWSNNPDHPLLNKAIQAQLAPGSVFKLVMSVAGLQENIAENKIVDCRGVLDFGGHQFHCHSAAHPTVHGPINIRQAITESCDVYFYTLGLQLGIREIDKYAHALGLGQRTGIDLPQEASGLVPTPEWKQRRFRQPWYQGETIPVSIGQGATTATPVQLARLVGGIATGGHFPIPHVAQEDQNTAGFDLPLLPATVTDIAAGMRGVVQVGGTAASAHLQGVDWGGKTGTAQVISDETLRKITGSHSRYVDNVWFVGASPVENPRIAVCVLYQRGAESSYAARIAAEVVKAFYRSSGAPGVAGLGPAPVSEGAGTAAAAAATTAAARHGAATGDAGPFAWVAPFALRAKQVRQAVKFGTAARPPQPKRRVPSLAQLRLGAPGPPSLSEHKRDARRSRAGDRAIQ